MVFHVFLKKCLLFLCAIFGTNVNFCTILSVFAHILCTNLPGSKLCQCYFVSFFHLCSLLEHCEMEYIQLQLLNKTDMMENIYHFKVFFLEFQFKYVKFKSLSINLNHKRVFKLWNYQYEVSAQFLINISGFAFSKLILILKLYDYNRDLRLRGLTSKLCLKVPNREKNFS